MQDQAEKKFYFLLQNRRFKEAEEIAREITRSNPNDALGHELLAKVLLEMGQLIRALLAAKNAVQLAPNRVSSLYALGVIHVRTRNYDEALTLIDRALAVNPNDPEKHHVRAVALLGVKRHHDAVKACDAGLALSPTHPHLHLVRAVALREVGDTKAANDVLDKNLQNDPNSECAHYYVGESLNATGEYKKAEQHYRESLRINPGHVNALNGLLLSIKSRNFLSLGLLRIAKWAEALPRSTTFLAMLSSVVWAVTDHTHRLTPQNQWLLHTALLGFIIFSQLPLIADPITTLLLRLNPKHKALLRRNQRRISNWQIIPLFMLLAALVFLPFLGHVVVALCFCLFARAVKAIEQVHTPSYQVTRRRLARIFLFTMISASICIIWMSGILLNPSSPLAIKPMLSERAATQFAFWTGLPLYLWALRSGFAKIKYHSRIFAAADYLCNTSRMDD